MNIYRGCTHGCIYCDSRSVCYRMTHDFEDIEVKINAPELLRDALSRRRKRCMIGTGSMCDPYMHCEEELKLTRRCLEIIEEYGFGLAVQTKSDMIVRDLDLLVSINERAKCVVQMTLTTYDEELCRLIEPNTASTAERFEVLKIMRDHGIPTVVWITPILPYINDTEENLRQILGYCFEAGVRGIVSFGMGVTLREGDREYFYSHIAEGTPLGKRFPGVQRRYAKRFGNSYECASDNSERLNEIFISECRAHGVMYDAEKIFGWMREMPEQNEQLSLFDTV